MSATGVRKLPANLSFCSTTPTIWHDNVSKLQTAETLIYTGTNEALTKRSSVQVAKDFGGWVARNDAVRSRSWKCGHRWDQDAEGSGDENRGLHVDDGALSRWYCLEGPRVVYVSETCKGCWCVVKWNLLIWNSRPTSGQLYTIFAS